MNDHKHNYSITREGDTTEMICSCGVYLKSKRIEPRRLYEDDIDQDVLVRELSDFLQEQETQT